MILWYRRDGTPYPNTDTPEGMRQVEKDLTNPEYKIVARDEKNGVRVSTVWLGLDHNLNSNRRKLAIFETMVFGVEDEPCERYSTEAEALEGHKKYVKKYL